MDIKEQQICETANQSSGLDQEKMMNHFTAENDNYILTEQVSISPTTYDGSAFLPKKVLLSFSIFTV